jgi:hypothetical protein
MTDFGMFTDAGETVVASLVDLAKKSALPWDTVETMLQALSNNEVFSEASDTAVREAVYCELYGA